MTSGRKQTCVNKKRPAIVSIGVSTQGTQNTSPGSIRGTAPPPMIPRTSWRPRSTGRPSRSPRRPRASFALDQFLELTLFVPSCLGANPVPSIQAVWAWSREGGRKEPHLKVGSLLLAKKKPSWRHLSLFQPSPQEVHLEVPFIFFRVQHTEKKPLKKPFLFFETFFFFFDFSSLIFLVFRKPS